jgi:hypothetical protein
VGGTTSAALSGQPLGTALASGLVGGTASGVSNYLMPSTPDLTSQLEKGLISSGISQGLTSVLGLDKSSPTQVASSYKPTTTGSTTTTGQPATTPGSQALGQALRVDPTATLGGGKDEGKPSENVWNVASLRVKDETGA